MEETKRRRGILKPLKHFDKYIEKNILLGLSWLELLLNILFLIIIFILLIFFINFLDIIIPIISTIIFLLFMIDIKIKHQNLFQLLKEKIIILMTRKIENKDKYKNKFKYIKKMEFNFIDNRDINNVIDIIDEKIEINFQIISLSSKTYLNSYISKLNTNNKFILKHLDEAIFINNQRAKNDLYILFNKFEEIDFILKNQLIKLSDLNMEDENKINEYYALKKSILNESIIYKNNLMFNDKYFFIFSISEINKFYTGWLIELLNINLELEVVQNFSGFNKTESLKITKSLLKIEPRLNKNKSEQVNKYNNLIKEYSKNINENNEILINLEIYIILMDNNLESLNNKLLILKNFLDLFLFKYNNITNKFNYLSCMNDKEINLNFFGTLALTSQIQLGFIKNRYSYLDESGILIGKDDLNYPVLFNQESFLENKNNEIFNGSTLILGKSGSGKSFLLKKIIYLSSLIKKQKIIILDVENEFNNLKKVIDNSVTINISKVSLDPFKLKFNDQNEHIIFLNSILNTFSNIQIDWTNELLDFMNSNNNISFWKFICFLKENNINKYEHIKNIDSIIYKNWFIQEFEDIIDYDLIILNFKGLFDKEILNNNKFVIATLTIIFSYISLIVFKNKINTINIIIDEAYKFFNFKNEIIDNIWFSLIKKSRKYKTLLTFSTQNYDDIFINKFTNRILNNIQYIFLGRLNEFEINSIIDNNENLKINKNSFIEELTNLKKGEFLLSKNNKYFIKIKNIIQDDVLNEFYI